MKKYKFFCFFICNNKKRKYFLYLSFVNNKEKSRSVPGGMDDERKPIEVMKGPRYAY
jgi:hypothetical protein